MNRMTPDLARLLVAERPAEAERRRRRRTTAARDEGTRPATAAASAGPVDVPDRRRGSGLLSRLIPWSGVRVPTR